LGTLQNEQAAAALELTDEQKTAVTALSEEMQTAQRELFQAMQDGTVDRGNFQQELDKVRNELDGKAKEKLSSDQQTKLTEMMGKPYDGVADLRAFGRGGRGRGRRGGGDN
jgi:hypothetical protein